MIEFMLHWKPQTLGPTWEYRFRQPSNEMAKEYTQKLAASVMGHFDRSMGMELFDIESGQLVAVYRLDKPTAYEVPL